MQKLDEKLLDMAIRLEMGGAVSGEDAARTVREALAEIDFGSDVASNRALDLEDEIDSLRGILEDKEREIADLNTEIDELEKDLEELQKKAA